METTMNAFSKAYVKFIQRKRVFCEGNVCCMSYGTHIEQMPDGSVRLLCNKHTTQKPKGTNEYSNS